MTRTHPLPDGGLALLLDGSPDLAALALEWSETRVPYVHAVIPLTAVSQAEALSAVGFRRITRLEFHSRPLPYHPRTGHEALRLTPWKDHPEAELQSLMLRTHQGTQDIPELNRFTTADTPLSPAPISLLAQAHGATLGVLLLTPEPNDKMEVTYLGVVPEARGHGWGAAILQAGLALATGLGAVESCLSFDERNSPARGLYGRFGFRLYELKQVWLWFHDSSSWEAHFP
ncbi:MAG: GNAT family N-acetyltransferase [Fimbriiglobus sp.]